MITLWADMTVRFSAISSANPSSIFNQLFLILIAWNETWFQSKNPDSQNVQQALGELYYYLLIKGVEHEQATGRAPLPRQLQVWKDAEELGADRLLLAGLEDRVQQAGRAIYADRLALNGFHSADSKDNPFLQVADLLTGSFNRVLNQAGEKQNHKDEFARYLLDALGIDRGRAGAQRAAGQGRSGGAPRIVTAGCFL